MTALWRCLLINMVAKQWSPRQICNYCRDGIDGYSFITAPARFPEPFYQLLVRVVVLAHHHNDHHRLCHWVNNGARFDDAGDD
jgi:hypothetical protein